MSARVSWLSVSIAAVPVPLSVPSSTCFRSWMGAYSSGAGDDTSVLYPDAEATLSAFGMGGLRLVGQLVDQAQVLRAVPHGIQVERVGPGHAGGDDGVGDRVGATGRDEVVAWC